MNELADGYVMHEWMKSLFPINRSLAGEGNRQTLKFIRSILPALRLNFFKSGDKVFDWTVPMEWKVLRAQLKRSNGDVILDFQNNNLHLVGYSRSVHAFLTLTELENHIYTSKEIHSAIPYVTSYYSPN